MVVNGEPDQRSNVRHLLESFTRIFRSAFTFAQEQRANQFAAYFKRRHGAKPYAGDIAGGAEKNIRPLAIDQLRTAGTGQCVDMFVLEWKDGSLGKDHKTCRGNGTQHGRLILKAKQSAGTGADRC